jgi:hypothetical protein
METILQRSRLLVSCMSGGAFSFMLLGYIAKAIPAVAVGIGFLAIAVNLFGLYLFFFYPDLKEEVTIALIVEIIAGVLTWM